LAWVYLFVAGILEAGWATAMKYSEGFTRLWPSVATIVMMVGSTWLLALALKHLPLGTAYGIWTGIGTVGAAVVGILAMGDSASPVRILCILLIVAGIAGLKLTS